MASIITILGEYRDDMNDLESVLERSFYQSDGFIFVSTLWYLVPSARNGFLQNRMKTFVYTTMYY